METERRRELDGIRGVAILMVLLWHYVACQVGLASNPALYYTFRVLSLTWSGVDLFFVLSGFLLGGILIDNRGASNYFRVFYVRRICRILPLYYAWLGVFLLVAVLWTDRTQPWQRWLLDDPMPLGSYALLVQNISMAEVGLHGANWLAVTWSLAIEEQFYLLVPLLIYLTPPRHLKWVLIALVVSAPILRASLISSGYSGFTTYVLMPTRADSLMLGVLAAVAIRSPWARGLFARHLKGLYFLAGLLLVAIVVVLRGPSRNPAVLAPPLVTYGLSLLSLFFVCILLIAVTEKRGLVTLVVRNRTLARLGEISYGVYVIHLPVVALFHGWLRDALPRINSWTDAQITAAATVATLVIARVSWEWFEKPIVDAGRRFSYHSERRATVHEEAVGA